MAEIIEGFAVVEVPQYPDIHDLHLHAAALDGAIDILLTNDKKLLDYGQHHDAGYGILDADSFLMFQTQRIPAEAIGQIYAMQRKYYLQHGVKDVSQALADAGAIRFASYIGGFA